MSGYPKRPKFDEPSRRPSVPILGLIVFSIILGAVSAAGWQVWLFVQPMLEDPAPPEFEQAVQPPAFPTPVVANPGESSAGSIGPGSRATVIEPIGLALRSAAGLDSVVLGGIVVGEIVTILEISADGQWQRVRRELNGQEGWVKAGNVEPVDGTAPAEPQPADLSSFPPEQRGRVRVGIGLAMRAAPSVDASRVGGVPFNEVVGIIENSADGRWQRIRRANGQEGWVKAGNLAQ